MIEVVFVVLSCGWLPSKRNLITATESQLYLVIFVQKKNSLKNNRFFFSRTLLLYAKTKFSKENGLLN